MTDTKELIDKLNDYLREIVVNNEQYEMFVEIKSFLEQQYQHEQNILNYGTDEPEEQQPQPDNELISVCCRAKIKIEYVDCGGGQGYPREICAKCRKEIIEVPIQPDEVTCNHDAIEWNPYNQVVQCHRCGEHWKPQPHPDELVERLLEVGLFHAIDLRQVKFIERLDKRNEAKTEIRKLLKGEK